LFVRADEDKSGTLDFDELHAAITYTGIRMTRSELMHVIKGSEP
jgi:hypothetical protein